MRCLLGAFLLCLSVSAQCPSAGTFRLQPVGRGTNPFGSTQTWNLLPTPDTLYLVLSPAGSPSIITCLNGGFAQVLWTAPQYAENETPAGTMDGSNRAFTLAHLPIGEPLIVLNHATLSSTNQYSRDGQNLGPDYTRVGTVITLNAIWTPQAIDTIRAWYRW